MNNSAIRQHVTKAHKPTKQPGTKEAPQNDKQLKEKQLSLGKANMKKSKSGDPVHSRETLRRNQKGYS